MNQQNEHSQVSTTWVENLALEELSMEETGVVHINEHLDPQILLEKASLKLMDELRDRFEFFTSRFNLYRSRTQDLGTTIKIFKISNTINDFMLFRNSLKLIVARKACDLITIGFLSNSGGLFSARLNIATPASNRPHEIKAILGPFNIIKWQFNGEPIDCDALVKHYLTEFIKHSAR